MQALLQALRAGWHTLPSWASQKQWSGTAFTIGGPPPACTCSFKATGQLSIILSTRSLLPLPSCTPRPLHTATCPATPPPYLAFHSPAASHLGCASQTPRFTRFSSPFSLLPDLLQLSGPVGKGRGLTLLPPATWPRAAAAGPDAPVCISPCLCTSVTLQAAAAAACYAPRTHLARHPICPCTFSCLTLPASLLQHLQLDQAHCAPCPRQ